MAKLSLKKRIFHRTAARIDRRTKKAVLKEILNSREFTSSRINKKLLEYLVEASIKNHTPSEYDIAINVFGRDGHFNPNEDAIVRVSIHNLRKKLEAYYQHEGKHARTRIEIPRGRYEVEFKHLQPGTRRFLLSSRAVLVAGLVVLAGLLVWSRVQVHRLERAEADIGKVRNHPVWSSIVKSRLPKLVVVGDDFFYLENDTSGEELIVRRHNVNSENDLERFVRRHPDLAVKGRTPYAFVPMACIKPLLWVLPIFSPVQKLNIQVSSALQSRDLLQNDVIFLGTFRNLYLLNEPVRQIVAGYRVGYGPNSVTLAIGDSLARFRVEGQPGQRHADYCLVLKIRGPNHNTVLMFVSFFETAMIGATHYMTNPQKLDELQHLFTRRFGSFPPYFKILFKTSGFSRTAFTTRVIYLDRIAPNGVEW